MCVEAKTNHVSLVSDLNTIEQLLDELWEAYGIVQCNLGIWTASGCSPLRMGVDSQELCAASHAFGSTSL